MNIIDNSKITSFLSYSLKLIISSFLLFSQPSLSEVFLYQNNSDTLFINIAKADTSDSWYDNSYLYRKEITINSAQVPNTDQVNFPILISLTDNALRTVANGGRVNNVSGYDIIFANQAGNAKLDYEIESYNGVTGTIVMWVKIPTLSHLNDTVIYIYYGNDDISISQENKTGVWNDGGNNFKGVWHLKEDPTETLPAPQILDSVSNTKNGTSYGGMTSGQLVAGKIENALQFDGIDDKISAGDISSSDWTNLTTSAWIYWTANGLNGYAGVYLKSNSTDLGRFLISDTGKVLIQNGNSSFYSNADGDISKNVWTHISYVYNQSAGFEYIYINNQLKGQRARTGNITQNTNSLVIGWGFNSTNYMFPGIIDEFRVSDTARSADWIATEYNNQFNPTPGAGNFILPLGIEESYATTYDLTAPSPSSGPINTASQTFTITPDGIYNGTITITPSGGGLSVPIIKTFNNSSDSQAFTITPTTGGTVTLTMTNSGNLINPPSAIYSSISISANPSSIIQGSTDNTIVITGINTSWTAGIPGVPTFTASGGNGASIINQIITDSTHTTITLNAGSTAGDLTVADPSTGATTTVSVVPSTSTLITSFNLSIPATNGIINNIDHTVSLTVSYGIDVTNLAPIINFSTGATISPASGAAHNFTIPVTYTVTAQDGTTTQSYIVTVTVSPGPAGGFISYIKPIIPLRDDRIDVSNLPQDIIQIAISKTPDFKDVSWEEFSREEIQKLNDCPDVLYIKFRNKGGTVSDVISYIPKVNSNLKDGDIVKTMDSPDVYIIKIKNNKKYKRLILSPSVFQSYGHLKWSNLKIISQEELNQYLISNLVKETTDTNIYELFPNGDNGERKMLEVMLLYDINSVYEINKVDRDSYELIK